MAKRETSHWHGGANTYLAEWGEYELSGGSTFRRKILSSVTDSRRWYSFYDDRLHVEAVLSCGSKYKRQLTWSLSSEVSDLRTLLVHGQASSNADAKTQADEWLVAHPETLRNVLSRYYSLANATLICASDGTALVSYFRFCTGNADFLPSGEYVLVDLHNGDRHTLQRHGGTTCGSFRWNSPKRCTASDRDELRWLDDGGP